LVNWDFILTGFFFFGQLGFYPYRFFFFF